jgi:VWFA-related protein
VTRVVDFTTDVRAIERAVQTATAGGGTALFDAISVALISASDPDRRQLIVAFTDGVDTSSTTDYDVLMDVAKRSHAMVTLMIPSASDAPTSGSRERNSALARLAAETGGWMMSTSNTDLSAAFKNALDEFRSTYLLHFIPHGVERRGFHTLSISVKRPSTTVRARRGYFGG